MAIEDIQTGANNLAASIKKHYEEKELKAKNQLQATAINKAILELSSQSGNPADLEQANKVLEAVGDKDPEVSKLIYGSIESRIRDREKEQRKANDLKGAFLVQIDPETNKPYMSDAITGERITDPAVIKGNASIFKETLTPEQMGARALATREATTENPILDQLTKGAIAAYEFINPRLDNAISILDGIGEKEFQNLATQISIGANNEFLVPNGSPLEDLVAELNDAKITGFGIAGSAYSDTEKGVVEGGLNPIGKGFKRFKRDLMRNKDFFSARAKAGTMGLKEARKVASKGDVYSAGKIKKFDNDKESRYQAWKKKQVNNV